MPPYILPVLIFSRVSSIYTQSRKKRSCRKKLSLRNRPVKMDSLFSYRSERHTKTNTADFGIRFSALSLLYGFKKISHWYSYSQNSIFFKKMRTGEQQTNLLPAVSDIIVCRKAAVGRFSVLIYFFMLPLPRVRQSPFPARRTEPARILQMHTHRSLFRRSWNAGSCSTRTILS